MKKNKKFILTVVVPTFNRCDELKKTLSILIKNKNPKICFLVLNNNSSDDSIKFINKLKKEDKRIILINHNKNIGAANNFRYGLKKSLTPYVCFVSDDDYLKGNYFDVCIEIFQKNNDVGIIHHDYGKNLKNKKNKFLIYKEGIVSAKNAYNLSTVIAGLAIRKNLVNFNKYPTDQKFIYSYMSQILLITKNFKFAKILNSAFYPLKNENNFKKKLKKNYEIQSRPYDYSIIELWTYILKSDYSLFDKMQIMQKKIVWISMVVSSMPKENYNKFLEKDEVQIGSYFKFFYIYIFFKKFEFRILLKMFRRLLSPKLFINFFFEIILLNIYILKKIFNIR